MTSGGVPIKIAVIAANGRLGRAFVKAALEAGHKVRAGVRDTSSFEAHPNLEVVVCDATLEQEVTELLEGQDVVASTIGHVKGSPRDVQTVATQITTSVMKKLGITRFVDVTGTGVRFPGDKITLADRVLNTAVEIIDRDRVVDGRTHQKVLEASSLSWTTIRVLKLQNVPMKPFVLKANGPTKVFVGRAEVAKAMLQVIEDNSFIRQAPIIGKNT